MRYLLIIFLCSFCLIFSINAHNYYIGLFEWHQKDKRHFLKVSLDKKNLFETLLMEDVALRNDFSDGQIKEAIKKYLHEHLQIWVNDKSIVYSFTEIRWQDDFVRLIVDMPVTQKPKKIHIKNTCLIKYFSTQKNVHKFFLFQEKQFAQLNKDKTEADIKY